ncbi:GNAT family N-acetyltransferase [Nonomuraea turkmeniaca]|uniref:GNAT family N-acetyltransferase n=1 Tax=Nonomuraea turkmeniaca TaxID=103838 RepID=A0A5S4FGS4_9ACTN|nr:GNAT family N-acetyltransferase [Nonomuraea turkmeniaca]TMR18685.1 GNAT family N-acetyltransferase [Nonomuraea turkmeniaca]
MSSVEQARRLWAGLARVPATFPLRGGVNVVVAPESSLCPPGWAGVVALDGAVLATVPDAGLIEPLRGTLVRQVREADIDLGSLPSRLSAVEVLGPATLAYLDAEDFVPAHAEVERVPVDHHDVRALMAAVEKADADESGLEGITSPAFVVRAGRDVVAAAGYRSWLGMAAHVCVLTAPGHRGRGLAREAASAAVADALAGGLLPQWRARPEVSRRVARALGFRESGSQLSILLTS